MSHRHIELYLNLGHAGNASQVEHAYFGSHSPDTPPSGERVVAVPFNGAWSDGQYVTVMRDFSGLRLVFEDEVPTAVLKLFSREELGKVVITDLVPDDVRRLKECAGFRGPLADNDPPYNYAWRVTGRESDGRIIWEIVVQADNIGWALKLFEEVRHGGHCEGEWMMCPWQAVGL